MRRKHEETLAAIFHDPVGGSIKWRDIEALLIALGAEMSKGSGSRVRFVLRDRSLISHRPRPSPDTDKGAVKAVRRYLKEVGFKP